MNYKKSLKIPKGVSRSHKSKKDRQHNEALDNSKHYINEILSGVKIPVTQPLIILIWFQNCDYNMNSIYTTESSH
jgi:hypothetical protein